jgi:hypothetical protein
LVEARFSVQENGLKRKLGAVVGMEVKFRRWCGREHSERGGKNGGGNGEAGLLQEITTIGVEERSRIDGVLFSRQRTSPKGSVVAKLTSA